MTITQQMAKHLRDVHLGGNWTCSNLKDNLNGLNWQQATTQVYGFNTIATLTYHMTYYVSVALKVLQGGPLDAKDEYSFNHPPIQSQEDWDRMLNKIWADVEICANLIEQLPDERLNENFTDEKYGSYYRNIQGIIEHLHYHLGQIALLKKIILQKEALHS